MSQTLAFGHFSLEPPPSENVDLARSRIKQTFEL